MTKDEEANLPKCLEKSKDIVDEVLVCDTGSTDRTVEVAKSLGASVLFHEWHRDMAEVRNYLMTRASCSHVLVLDADESFSAGDHTRFRDEAEKCMSVPGASICFPERNYTKKACSVGFVLNRGEYPQDEVLAGWFVTPSVRFMPVETRYRGNVHENPMVDAKLITFSDIPLHHWAQINPARQGQKGWYYEAGVEKLKKYGDNVEIRRELGAQAMRDGNYEEGLEHWMKAVAFAPRDCVIRTNYVSALVHCGKFAAAKHHAYLAQGLDKNNPDAAYNCAWCELLLGNPDRTAGICKGILSVKRDYVPAVVLGIVAGACASTDVPFAAGVIATLRKKFSRCDNALEDVAQKLLWANQVKLSANLTAAMLFRGGADATDKTVASLDSGSNVRETREA
jgi:hypothetical protein